MSIIISYNIKKSYHFKMPKSLGFTRVTAGFYSKFSSISPLTSLLAEAAEFSPCMCA